MNSNQQISNEKNTIQKLLESEERWRSITQFTPDYIMQLDLKGNILLINRTVPDLSIEEVIGKPIYQFVLEKYRENMKKVFEKVLNTGELVNYETGYRDKEGDNYFFEAQVSPLLDAGQIVGYLVRSVDITKRKMAEEKLKESEEKLRAIINGLEDPLHVINQDLEIVLINDALRESIINFNLGKILIGMTINEAFPFLPDNVLDEYRSVFNNKSPLITVECTFLDGKEITTETRKIPIFDDEENVIQIITIIRDITEAKDAELKLKESQEKWKALSENSPAHIMLLDRDHKILSINRTVPDLSKEEVIGTSVYTFVPQEFYQIARDSLNSVWETGEPTTYSTNYITKEGETQFFDVWIGPVIQSGKIFALVSHSMDVTEKKQAELKLKESEEKFRGFLDFGNIGMAIISIDKKWVYYNDQICEIFGFTREELLEKTWADLSYPEDLQSDVEQFNKILKGEIDSYQIDKRYIKKNGEIIYAHLTISCIRNSDGSVKHFLATLQDITESKNAEQSLKESEKFVKSILNTVPSHVYIYDWEKNQNIYSAPHVKAILGYTPEELSGLENNVLPSILHPSDESKFNQVMEKLMSAADNEIIEGEYRFRHKNGQWVHVFDRAMVFKRNSGGQVLQILGSAIDITERVEFEKKLKESQEKWKALSENSPAHIMLLDRDHKILSINRTVPDLSKEEVIGTSVYTFVPQEFHQVARNSFNSVWKTGKPVTYFTNYITKEGDVRFFEVWVGPVFQSGKVTALVGHSMDVTEKKRAELKLKESEEKYRTFVQNIQGIAFQGYQDFSVAFFDGAVEDITGYTPEDFRTGRIKWDHIIYPDDRPIIQKKVETFHSTSAETDSREYRVVRKDGELRWILEKNQKIYDNIKMIEGVQGIMIDITQRKKAEEKLKELSNLKSEFLRRASHELKTPLISIKGFSDLILSLYIDQLDPVIISKLREINGGCERLQNIINNLLKTSRLESPELKPKLQKEDLSFLIKFCVHELESLAERRNQSIKLDIQNDLYANIEKEEIHDVVSNLLTNAIKYTPPMGKIEIQAELNDRFVVISVNDNGIGFTNEQKKMIFQQFGKIERYGQGLDLGIDGTGLGLYISKKIVESHGGKIWMESEGKSQGSTFYFTLPTA